MKNLALFCTLLGSSGLALGQASSTQSSPVTPVIGGGNPGQFAGLITMQGLQTAGVIGNAVSGAAGGNPLAAGGVRRFALPGQTGAAGAAGGKPWNAWVAYSRNDVAYNFAPLQSSGKVQVGLVGVDYTLANNIIVGVAVAGDRSDINLNFNGGTLKGDGYTISPYLGMALNKAWTLDASVGLGRTKLDVNNGRSTGSFNADRQIGSIGVAYRQSMGNWLMTGRGALLAVQDKLGAYTLSNGTFVSDGTVNIAQLRLGGQLGYNLGGVVPYFGLNYIYDVRRPDQQAVAGQNAANDRDSWTPTLGMRFSSGGALYGGIQYSSEQRRAQVKNNQLLFNLGIRF